jgi:hypothetical protein
MSSLNTVLLTTTNSLSKSAGTIEHIFHNVENDKFFISLIGIVVFLTGRSLYNELYHYCSNDINFLEYHYVKKITLWSVLFLYSRSILHATILSILFILAFPPIFFTDIYTKIKQKE